MGKRLDDKVAVVTSGCGGLSEDICLCLARERAHVVVSDVNLSLAGKVSAKVKGAGQKILGDPDRRSLGRPVSEPGRYRHKRNGPN